MKFAVGLIFGITLGVILAPSPGASTRRQIAGTMKKLLRAPHSAVDDLATKTREKAGEIGARVGHDAAEAAVAAIQREVMGG